MGYKSHTLDCHSKITDRVYHLYITLIENTDLMIFLHKGNKFVNR